MHSSVIYTWPKQCLYIVDFGSSYSRKCRKEVVYANNESRRSSGTNVARSKAPCDYLRTAYCTNETLVTKTSLITGNLIYSDMFHKSTFLWYVLEK